MVFARPLLLLELSRDILLASANKLKIVLPGGKRRHYGNEFALMEWSYGTYNSLRAEALISRLSSKYIYYMFSSFHVQRIFDKVNYQEYRPKIFHDAL